MRTFSSLFLTTAILSFAIAEPAYADDWRWHGDIQSFPQYDYGHWRQGYWYQGFHEGRNGSWWIVGDSWYFYPAPVYPYPDPYTPPAVIVEPVPPAPVNVAPSYAYYCRNPAGYYPYVPECYRPGRRVLIAAAAPLPPAPAPVISPPPVSGDSQRDRDDRQLDAFGAEFIHINLNDEHARHKLKELQEQVYAYRQTLYDRSYNATDIMKDADNLEHRIAAQREKLAGHDEATTAPMPLNPPPAEPMMRPAAPPVPTEPLRPVAQPPAEPMMLPAAPPPLPAPENTTTGPASPAATPVNPVAEAPLPPATPDTQPPASAPPAPPTPPATSTVPDASPQVPNMEPSPTPNAPPAGQEGQAL